MPQTLSSPPIEIKKLRKFITILVNRDNNRWTSHIPIDAILPVQRSKHLPELPNNLLRYGRFGMKSSTLDKVHHSNKQPHSRNLITKPKLRCTVFLIRNLVCS